MVLEIVYKLSPELSLLSQRLESKCEQLINLHGLVIVANGNVFDYETFD